MKKIFSIMAIVALSACSAGQNAANEGGGYVWIGCHVVTKNPNKGAYAFDIAGDKFVGSHIWWKQEDKDGKVGPVTTAVPCKEDKG